MKFIVSSSLLLRQCQAISGVLQSSNALPILDDFLFVIGKSELTLSGSDLETTMTVKLPIESKTEGKIAVPARILLDTLKTFSEQPLTFSIDDKTFAIEISSDYGKYKIAGNNGDDFPKMPEMSGGKNLEMPASTLVNAINRTVFATGNDEIRPVMNGVFFQLAKDSITFVATDAHRLVKYTRKDVHADVAGSFILPKKPLNLLKNFAGTEDSRVQITYNDSNAFFKFDNFELICRLIEGKYPNYEAVIPKENPNQLTADRIALLNSIRRVSLFSNKTTHQVRLKMAGSELHISAEDLDYSNAASERLTCSFTGEDMEIGFNARFLVDMLQNLDTTEVMIEMSAPNRAGLLVPTTAETKVNEGILMLVMPVMLNA